MESSSEEQNLTKKTSRTRVRARRASSADRERASRRISSNEIKKEASRKVSASDTEIERVEKVDTRKAPTPLASKKNFLSQKRKRTIIATFFLLLGVGASAAVGMTDSGQIDVNKTIEERNERIRNNITDDRDVGGSMVEVPVQNTNVERRGDGGLRGRGIVNPPPTPVSEADISSSTASSSDKTASSTEEIITDEEEDIVGNEILEEEATLTENTSMITE